MTDEPRPLYADLSNEELFRLAQPANAPSDARDRQALADELRRRKGAIVADRVAAAGGFGSSVQNRYRDAYLAGAALVGLGNTIKLVGAALAGVILLVSLAAGGPLVLGGIVIAAINGGLFWVCGVVVAAQGQILRATLDNVVGHSPFLSDSERLDAMGLPRSFTRQSA